MVLYINQSNNHMYLVAIIREKKGYFVINSGCYQSKQSS